MIPLGPVVARSRIKAARSDVWSYLSDPGRRAEWWPELQLDPRVGGAVTERWTEEAEDASVSRDAEGAVDVWVEGHAIGFTWREAGDERDTAVLITLRTQGLETGVTITETGFDALPSAAGRAAASQEGWQVLLRDFATAVDRAVADGTLAAAGAATDRADEGGAPADEGSAAVAAVGAELVVTPEEIEGEVEEPEAVETSLEVDPEPGLGEHLELDTGSVPIVDHADGADEGADGADEGAAAGSMGSVDDAELAEEVAEEAVADSTVDDDPTEGDPAEGDVADAAGEARANDTGRIDRESIDDAMDELGLAELASGGTEGDAHPESADEDEEPEEPDFDTLIRGH